MFPSNLDTTVLPALIQMVAITYMPNTSLPNKPANTNLSVFVATKWKTEDPISHLPNCHNLSTITLSHSNIIFGPGKKICEATTPRKLDTSNPNKSAQALLSMFAKTIMAKTPKPCVPMPMTVSLPNCILLKARALTVLSIPNINTDKDDTIINHGKDGSA